MHGAGRGMHGGRGACVVPGGMHGAGGHVWCEEACMVPGDMRGGGACMVAGGMHGGRGVCGVVGGVHGGRRGVCGGGGMCGGIRRDTVNERAVPILLECILVMSMLFPWKLL